MHILYHLTYFASYSYGIAVPVTHLNTKMIGMSHCHKLHLHQMVVQQYL